MKIAVPFGFLLVLWQGSCVSNESSFLVNGVDEPMLSAQIRSSVPSYVQSLGEQIEAKGAPIQWFSCIKDARYPFLVMISPTQGEFTKTKSCTHLVAIEGMKNGFNVFMVNTPKQADQNRQHSFGDEESLRQIQKLLVAETQAGRRFSGLWGFGDGSILAMQLSRILPWNFLVIGNGIYDWEQAIKESKDPVFTERLKSAAGDDPAIFAEKHSIAWDLTGMPKKIYLYHGSKNTQILASQVDLFRTSLAVSEYQAEVFFLDTEGDYLRAELHSGVLNKIFSRCQNEH